MVYYGLSNKDDRDKMKKTIVCGHKRMFKGRMVICSNYRFANKEMCDKCIYREENYIGNVKRLYKSNINPEVVIDLKL